ncbi:TIGR02186 family protein [Desulfotruncus alcoholivorax]|uniref:TIGR02186 family protein n=1 Tax=Desulfotruncus alcoholivorax TaxID=265477 RepID=UPI0003F5640D|nr:TIGR02186 family protein [Desulfotruncus alcoholivorax]
MRLKRFTKTVRLAATALMIVLVCAIPALAETAPVVSPQQVNIGLNFKGADLTVSGAVPEGADVYIKVTSPNDSVLELNKKGRVGGMWMNVENTEVSNVPKLYQIISSQKITVLPQELREELGLTQDFEPIYQNAIVEKKTDSGSVPLSGSEARSFVSSLIKIYQKSGLYAVNENAVKIEHGQYRATIQLPPNIPQETCQVTVYTVKGGSLLGSAVKTFNVNTVGITSWLNHEAIVDGPTYGLIAVLIALFFGTGIAFLFGYIEKIVSGGKSSGFNAGASH